MARDRARIEALQSENLRLEEELAAAELEKENAAKAAEEKAQAVIQKARQRIEERENTEEKLASLKVLMVSLLI